MEPTSRLVEFQGEPGKQNTTGQLGRTTSEHCQLTLRGSELPRQTVAPCTVLWHQEGELFPLWSPEGSEVRKDANLSHGRLTIRLSEGTFATSPTSICLSHLKKWRRKKHPVAQSGPFKINRGNTTKLFSSNWQGHLLVLQMLASSNWILALANQGDGSSILVDVGRGAKIEQPCHGHRHVPLKEGRGSGTPALHFSPLPTPRVSSPRFPIWQRGRPREAHIGIHQWVLQSRVGQHLQTKKLLGTGNSQHPV